VQSGRMPHFRRCLIGACAALSFLLTARAQTAYAPPETPRLTWDFNPGWKFIREDVAGAEEVAFDDTPWATVSTPHSYNETDSFRTIISHGGGDRGTYKGIGWYRKHFKIPAAYAGRKLFLEFEGLRQAGDFYLNGKAVGLYENGITGFGLDITDGVHFGEQDNVLAVKVDNRSEYEERATHTRFEWNVNDFNPNFGGINRRVWLHVAGPIFQTLPLYCGLQTTGTYIHAGNFDIPGRRCDVTVESEVQNDSGDRATVTLSAVIVDREGKVQAQWAGDAVDMVAGERSVLNASGPLAAARFWSCGDPYLYSVYTLLTVSAKAVDAVKTTTGFRKAEFKGGAGTGGVYLNDQFVWLTGFSQRSSDEWAGLGAGYPTWMHDLTAQLVREDRGNYVRWMHVSPQKVDVEACDRAGIVEVCPAGDKERDVQGRQWDQRVEVMRDSMVAYRNNPSILFWEAGNTIVTPEQMQQMVALRKQWDPDGGRVMGTRDNDDSVKNTAITPYCEYYGVMVSQDATTDRLKGPQDIFRGYSAERRDRAPLVETEDFRDEAARRFWDDASPPHFGFKKGPLDTYPWNSESFCLVGAGRYWDYWSNRISNSDPAHARWSAYASIYFSDSDADGRQDSSEVCRVSGKVDSVRLPKELYYVQRVMQNEQPDIHLIGHWTYPAGTQKTIYVAASHVENVELFRNGKSLGRQTVGQSYRRVGKAADLAASPGGFIYAFPAVDFEPGTLKAVGSNGGQAIVTDERQTAGAPKSLKLTVRTGPHGLEADGADVALIDVEVVDAAGRRCPTDEARVDFAVQGPGIWRGGVNSGLVDSTNNLYLNTECGINRVAIRSTLAAGTITLTASRDGLASAQVEIPARTVAIMAGLEGPNATAGRD
jgi:beta-galactosidase